MNDLIVAVTESVHSMGECALAHFEADNLEAAAAVINEWTTESGESILTHHYTETTNQVKDIMMYSFVENDEFGYGNFSFDPEAEIPVD